MRRPRHVSSAVVVLALVLITVTTLRARAAMSAADTEILVTTPGDSIAAGATECPHATKCSLRRAIELANTTAAGDAVGIAFDPAVFPANGATTIEVLDTALPAITRAHVRIDARGAGVVIDGSDLAGVAGADGISSAADTFELVGLTVHSFPGACVAIEGDGATIGGARGSGLGNRLDDCGIGIAIAGDGAVVQGNFVGLNPESPGVAMTTGIEAIDGNALVGVLAQEDEGNVIGNAATGVVFRASTGRSMTGAIRGNTVGATLAGTPAPVTTGVTLVYNASNVDVTGNHIANATNGVVIPDNADPPSQANTLRGNTYHDVQQLAIDLGGDGRTVNDPVSPGGNGANGLLSYPEFSEATPDRIAGRVPGPCAACTVDLYVAERRLDERPDLPTIPITGATTTTDAGGGFSFVDLHLAAGTWIMAIATDPDGNTSEFSDPVRVSAGAVQCDGVTLRPGWNVAGFFGASQALVATFPAGSASPGPVLSIHQLNSGTRQFDSWFANGQGFGDLDTLSTGKPYWFYATTAAPLPGSLTLTAPLPVTLKAGWNDFVYIGSPETVAGALESIDGKWSALYRWVNDGPATGWQSYGGPDAPPWARDFTQMTPCAVYQIFMTEAGTLTPPQP